MERLLQDIRFAFRALFRNRGFSAVTITILALGISANTTIFSFVSSLAFQKPEMVRRAEGLVTVLGTYKGQAGSFSLSYLDYVHYRNYNTAFSDLAEYGGIWLYLLANGRSNRVYGHGVSSNYFSVLGLKPRLGRFFLPDEDSVPVQSPVMVIWCH